MKNKYYTPEIEEFCVGFEYEIQDIENAQWGVCICTPGFGAFDDDIDNLEDDRIRVKYLDKEDIESLGWIFDKTSNKSQWKFHKNNIMLYYRSESKEIGFFTIDPSKSDFFMEYSRDNKMISFLIIKNKSELKKLLRQLNIE